MKSIALSGCASTFGFLLYNKGMFDKVIYKYKTEEYNLDIRFWYKHPMYYESNTGQGKC